MAELRKVIVKFNKSEKKGRVCVEFFTELTEPQDRVALTLKFKEDVELSLTKDGFSWSNLFKVTEVSSYSSGHKWIKSKIDLLRAHKPLEWSEELYEACIAYQVRQLCHYVEDDVDVIEEDLLQEKFPEVSRTFWFDEG